MIIWIDKNEIDAQWYASAIAGAFSNSFILYQEELRNEHMIYIAKEANKQGVVFIGLVEHPTICGTRRLGLVFFPHGGKAKNKNTIIYNPKDIVDDRDKAVECLLKEIKERKLGKPLV